MRTASNSKPDTYVAAVDVRGRVTRLDGRRRRFSFQLEHGRLVECSLADRQLETLRPRLVKGRKQGTRLRGRGEYSRSSGELVRVTSVRQVEPVAGAGSAEEKQGGLSALMAIVEDLHKNILEEAWKDVPSDGSINYRHYLYGHKKVKP